MAEKYFKQPDVGAAQKHFSQVPAAEIQRSKFDRSHGVKTTFNAGKLVPVFVDEVLPGDTFHLDVTAFCRLATPLKPIMDNLYLDTHFFFVPYRLVWDNWAKFMGERTQPEDDPNIFSVPQTVIDLSATVEESVAQYMGLPPRPSGSVSVSALPFRAYDLIWNEWFRDQNLQTNTVTPTGDGPDTGWGGYLCRPRGKRHDYFTSCLPWPQKGDPVTIPLGDYAPVGGLGVIQPATASPGPITVRDSALGDQVWSSAFTTIAHEFAMAENTVGPAGFPFVYADLTLATAVTINDLRSAFQIQRLLERDARGGTRYIELVLSHFGVRSDDARLQRPEYLGGGSQPVNINPIASTVSAEGTAPQGNLAAFGTGVGRGGFSKSFTEHGIVIGLVSSRADLTYQQGVERFWSRKTRYDFYWPALAHLGEQAVYNKEIFVQGTPDDDLVFGYQERYAEYRYKPSRITGLFNSEVAASLDVWHLAQDFETLPVLNASFIADSPPIDRIIAVPSEPHFLCDIWFSFQCERPMPVYSVPGLIDHF